jgi:hypothetical protein
MAAKEFVTWYVGQKSPEFKKTKQGLIGQINGAIAAAEKVVSELALLDKNPGSSEAQISAKQQELLTKNVALSGLLSQLVGKDPSIGKAKERYKLEGMTGTYGSIPKPTGDLLTADHQPQAAVLQAAATFGFFDPAGALVKRAAKRAHQGFAVNLHQTRHMAGRTFGAKGKGTKGDFIETLKSKLVGKKEAEQRAIVVGQLKADLQADVKAMTAVANAGETSATWADIMGLDGEAAEKKALVQEVRGRIHSGEAQLASQDLDSLVK